MPARGILQEEAESHGAKDSANGDSSRRGSAVEHRRRGSRGRRSRARTRTGAGARGSTRGSRLSARSRGLGRLGAGAASRRGRRGNTRQAGDGTGASSGGLLRRLGADRGRYADGRLDGSAAGQSDAGQGREHTRAGLLASAVMEEGTAAGRVVRGNPAVVGATAGDNLAVGSGRATDV